MKFDELQEAWKSQDTRTTVQTVLLLESIREKQRRHNRFIWLRNIRETQRDSVGNESIYQKDKTILNFMRRADESPFNSLIRKGLKLFSQRDRNLSLSSFLRDEH